MGRVDAGDNPFRESDLSGPAAAWLRERGFTVYAEVPFLGRCLDLVGLHPDGRVCVVELKLSLTKELASQITCMRSSAHELYVVVRSFPRMSARPWLWLEGAGVGVLRFKGGCLGELRSHGGGRHEAREGAPFPGAVKQLRRMCAAAGEGDQAGFPTRKGIGPAQAVCDEVEGLLKSEPSLSWRELFERVPNHYASWKSMRGAISRVRESRKAGVA